MDNVATSPEQMPSTSPNHPVLRHYMRGTYANLFKLMMWWVALPAVTAALVPSYGAAVGVGRIVFSAALVVFSPIGGILAERVPPKTILIRAALARFAVWCFAIPLVWVFCDSQWFPQSHPVVFTVLNVGLFVEGMAVALSVVLDIDNCGLDIIGNYYNLNIDDNLRNLFNTKNEMFQAFCFVIMNPGLAFATYYIKTGLHGTIDFTSETISSGILMAVFFLTFFVATAFQVWHFAILPRPTHSMSGEASPLLNDKKEDKEAGPSLMEQIKPIPGELWAALKIIFHHQPIMWRLIFLGLEIALEDASIVVVAGQIGKDFKWLGNGDPVDGFKWTAVIVAVGKLGGAIASFVMMKKFEPPKDVRGNWFLFVFILLAGSSMALIPGIDAWHDMGLSDNACRALIMMTYFIFFFFSTLPKLGLMCLLQSMATQIEDGHRIFGFIGVIVTAFDGGITLGLSVVFTQYPLQQALWISASFFMAHGVLELVFGPTLILAPLKHDEEKRSRQSSVARSEEGGDRSKTPEPHGLYSEHSASVPIGGGGDRDVHRSVVLSTSFTASVGSAMRRTSGLDVPGEDRPTYVRRGSSMLH